MKKLSFTFLVLFCVSCQKHTSLERGKALYEIHCASCHGLTGDGRGIAAEFLWPKPRDLTLGVYKYRSTRGPIPTDLDLMQTMRVGIPGTSMPGWDVLKTQDWRSILVYLKTLSPRLKMEKPGPSIDIPEEPKATAESVQNGKHLYNNRGCVACHGPAGRGDGPAAVVLKDIWGDRIAPRDLTQGPLKWGTAPREIYRTLMTGVPGTPMPGYEQTFTKNELWSLVHYIRSIQKPIPEGYDPSNPKRNLLTVSKIDGDIPLDAADAAWEQASAIPVFLKPLWHEAGAVEWLTAKALHNGKAIAFLVSWKDNVADTDATHPDALGIQLPQAGITDPSELPYLGMGNSGKPVNIWEWKAPKNFADANATGLGTARPQKESGQNISGNAEYKDGEWRVILKRNVVASDPQDAPILDVGFVSFSLWDADQPPHPGPESFSEWMYYELKK